MNEQQIATAATVHEYVRPRTPILTDIILERIAQDLKWGPDRDLPLERWLAILTEEVGEVAKAILDEETLAALRAELVQVAAVAVAFLEAIDRAVAEAAEETPRELLS